MTVGTILVFSSIAASECSDRPSVPRDLKLLLLNETREAVEPRQPPISTKGRCVPVGPTLVHLTGVVGREQRLGPPGYGENPEADQRITIYVLRLTKPLHVCVDTTSDEPRAAVDRVTVIQLTGNVDLHQLRRHLGMPLSVFGTLYRQTWGRHVTEVLMRVDSIPIFRLNACPACSRRS